MINTKKLYYNDVFATDCIATVVSKHNEKGIILDQTVAFPEGGGQMGDHGTLHILDKELKIYFNDTQKGVGRLLPLSDFPSIQVDTPIYHSVNKSEFNQIDVGDKVKVEIDTERRTKLMQNHTGIHLVIMGIEKLYPGLSKWIKGAAIKEDNARIDFAKQEKFSQEDIGFITNYVNELIEKDYKINVYPHPDEPEAWYWECCGFKMPCGGTHLPSTSFLKNVVVKRKTRGKGIERIIAEFPDARKMTDFFH